MTREEQIFEVAERHSEFEYNQTTYSNGFIDGARWADNNPKLHWISVDDDLPCNHEEFTHSNYTDRVLISARNGFVEVAFMSKIENVWVWETPIKVSHWMPIPELPKR